MGAFFITDEKQLLHLRDKNNGGGSAPSSDAHSDKGVHLRMIPHYLQHANLEGMSEVYLEPF